MMDTWRGHRENNVWRAVYSQSGKRSRKRAETKVFFLMESTIKNIETLNLSDKRSVR
jgi:hypothetical protein